MPSAPWWTADRTWDSLKTNLKHFPTGFSVLEMCAGCGTAGVALDLLLGPGRWTLSGVYDRDRELKPVLEAHVAQRDMSKCHLGPAGDLTAIALEDFPDAHCVVAGPPCPPWSSLGARRSFQDERTQPFFKVIDVIAHLAARVGSPRPLAFFVLENVTGIGKKAKGQDTTPLSRIQALLRSKLEGNWTLRVHTLNAADYGLPQSRNRVYLVGTNPKFFPNSLFGGGGDAGVPTFACRVRPEIVLDMADTDDRHPIH